MAESEPPVRGSREKRKSSVSMSGLLRTGKYTSDKLGNLTKMAMDHGMV